MVLASHLCLRSRETANGISQLTDSSDPQRQPFLQHPPVAPEGAISQHSTVPLPCCRKKS